jgi:hypothetical protein
MNPLVDRYLIAALEHIPDDKRADIARDIRVAIDEMVEQRIDAGAPEEAAVRGALTELGDPAKLASTYVERRQFLIGPGWYPLYIEVLKRVAPLAIGIIAAITLVTGLAFEDTSAGALITDVVESVLMVGLQFLFWVTLGFVIAERTVGPEGPQVRTKAWTVDDLPDLPARRPITFGQVLPEVVVLLMAGVLVIAQHVRGLRVAVDGDDSTRDMPLFNPDLTPAWAVPFFALMAVSIAVAVYRLMRGVWTERVLIVSVIDSGLWIAFAVVLAFAEPIFNVDLMQRIDEGGNYWDAGGRANLAVAAVITVISLQGIWEAWRGYREYERPGLPYLKQPNHSSVSSGVPGRNH